jgi:arylsulfatase A-like enzyme
VARGALAGVVAGAVWWLVEGGLNWTLGGYVPGAVALRLLLLDLGFGAAAGVLLGALLALAGRSPEPAVLALGLAGAYGLLRVYAPPGLGTEAIFVALAAVAATAGVALAGARARGALAFVQLSVVGTAAVALGEFVLDQASGGDLGGIRLPVLLAVLPLAGVVVDRVLAAAVPRQGARFAVELAAAVLAAVVWGRPLATVPLDDPLVTAVPPPPGTPDVLVVSLDTTRADHLSTYGYPRDTSPNLTAFAADALRFTQARSPAAWTLPGHASLFTGKYPSRHGAHLAGAWLPGRSMEGRRQVAFPLHARAVTLAETLRDRGYRTAGFVANFSYLYRDFGVAQGFAHYEDRPALLFRLRPHAVRAVQRFVPSFCLKSFRSAWEINAAALSWLDAAPAGRPVFMFVNYLEPHQPWLASPPWDRWSRDLPHADRLAQKDLYTHEVKELGELERAFIVANYDGQVAAMDAAFGELIEALRARGRYEDTMIVVTSDHGEFLGEHGQLGHTGRMLYEPVLAIPLVVKWPGAARPRGEAHGVAQLVDVLPTVAAATGAVLPADVQGEVLPDVTHAALAEEDINPFLVSRYGETYNRAVRVLYDGTYKLISTSRGEHMLFDLARDPEERHDLSGREPERLSTLRGRLEALLGAPLAVAAAPLQVD